MRTGQEERGQPASAEPHMIALEAPTPSVRQGASPGGSNRRQIQGQRRL
jgi:hypothetical protein